jgi:hypothetical protein
MMHFFTCGKMGGKRNELHTILKDVFKFQVRQLRCLAHNEPACDAWFDQKASYVGKKTRERLDLAILTPSGMKLLVDFTVVFTTSGAPYRALGDGIKRSTALKMIKYDKYVQGTAAEDAVLRIAAVESTGLRGKGFNTLILNVAHAAHPDNRSLKVAARHTLEQAVSVTLMTGLANIMREGTQMVRHMAEVGVEADDLADDDEPKPKPAKQGTTTGRGKGGKAQAARRPSASVVHKPKRQPIQGYMTFATDDTHNDEQYAKHSLAPATF